MVSAIVAVDNNWGIGFNGNLLERIPADLKRFKELTTGHVVVMGRKTWDSLPKKPLPNRLNIIISHQERSIIKPQAFRLPLDEAKVRVEFAAITPNEEWFVIGGGQIYKELLPYCDRVYVTKIYKDHENIDTYFPNLDKSNEWTPISLSTPLTYDELSYQFWQYDRI